MRIIAGRLARRCQSLHEGADPKAECVEQIRHHQSSASTSGPVVFTVLLVPRATELCRKVLEDEGVAGDVNVEEVSSLRLGC